MACILLWSSAVRVHDSQAYRSRYDKGAHQSYRGAERNILPSFQTGFSLVSAAVVSALLESISGLEPSSVITEPRYLKMFTTYCLLEKTNRRESIEKEANCSISMLPYCANWLRTLVSAGSPSRDGNVTVYV